MYELLPENLQVFRKKVGLAQSKAAYELGIEISTLSNYENGRRRPSVNVLVKIAELYKVSVDDLLGRVHDGKKFLDLATVLRNSYGELSFEILETVKELDQKERCRLLGYAESIRDFKKSP